MQGVDILLNIQEKKSAVIGRPSIDYPIISNITKKSSFSCQSKSPGLYADHESGCIRYFQCNSIDVMSISQQGPFFCANGTLFDQRNQVCSWWYNVDCSEPPEINENNLNKTKLDNKLDFKLDKTKVEHTKIDNLSTNIYPVYVPNLKNKN